MLEEKEQEEKNNSVSNPAPEISISVGQEGKARLWWDNKGIICLELVVVGSLVLLLQFLDLALFAVFLVIAALLWAQKRGWRSLGLEGPVNWISALVWGLGLGCVFLLLQLVVLQPLIAGLIHQQPDLRTFTPLRHDIPSLARALLMAWTASAFGEELIFRGYLLNRFADLFGHNYFGWTIAVCVQAALFGFVHLYQGLAGALIAGCYGLLAGVWYLGRRRNLWANVFAHGLSDTLAYLLIFLH